MKKTFLAALCCLCMCSFAFANAAVTSTQPQNYFDGFYAGLGIGAANLQGKIENNLNDSEEYLYQTVNANDPNNTYNFVLDSSSRDYNLNKGFNKWGFVGQVFGGYGKTLLQHLYLGGELFIRATPVKANISTTQTVKGSKGETSIDVENYTSAGAAARVGFLITPKIMIYGLFGIDNTFINDHIKHNGTAVANGSEFPEATIGIDKTVSTDHVLSGLMPGIGIEAMVTNKLSLRAQYTYSFYQSDKTEYYNNQRSFSKVTSVSNIYNWYGNSEGNIKNKNLSRNAITVDLTYHFNGLGWSE